MTIKSVATDLGILLAVAAIALGAGYARGDIAGNEAGVAKGNAQLLQAQSNARVASENTKKVQDALGQLQSQLATQKQELQDAQKVASAALAQRDTLKSQLSLATTQRIAADRKLAHETPDCASLDRLPICPELSHRLWPQTGQASPTASGANGR